MGTATVKHAADTWIDQVNQDTNFNVKPRLHLRTLASNNRYGLMYFNKPWPAGASIISAKLRVYAYEAWAGSQTLTVQRTTKWALDKVDYRNQPTVTGATASVTQSGTAANALYEIDVTAIMQAVASGGTWYGLRLSTSSTTDVSVHSAQSPVGQYRPVMVITWNVPPDQADGLRPGGGRMTSLAYPFLAWNYSDPDGAATLQSVQVQFGASQVLLDAGTATWDSGTIPTTEPNLDLSSFVNMSIDPGMEAGIAEWLSLNSSTLVWSTTQVRTGTHSLQITAAGTSNSGAISVHTFPVLPGQVIQASAYTRAAATARTIQIRIKWYTSTGAFISDSAITSLANNTTGWTRISTGGNVAPSNAAFFAVQFNSSVNVAGEVFYIDDFDVSVGGTGSTGSFTALTSGATSWWRVRNQDDQGVWGAWSDSVSFGTLSKGVLTITSPSGSITEASPVVAWTFTGRTQKSYQVAISLSTDPNNWLWDSGKITSGVQNVSIPFGYITDPTLSYIIRVRVWDDQPREGIPGDTPYVEAITASLAVTYSASVTNVTGTAFVSDVILPKGTLTFSRTTAPDVFQLQQSDDSGTTWYYIDEALPAEITTGGTGYSWPITTAKQYVSHQWRVLSVVGGIQSQNPPAVSGTIARLCPVLMRTDGTDACFFMNPERDRQRLGIQGLHERMGGPPVLVTQRLGGQSGHVKGRFIDGYPTGKTAAGMHKDFLDLEVDSGQTMKLVIANETLDVVAFNFNTDTLTDEGGITYQAEFDWIAQ